MSADLKVDWCSYKAAKFAVMHWHYSKTMPSGKLVKVGVWEDGTFIGCILFGRGANNHIGLRYKITQAQVCELVRVALRQHKLPASSIVSKAVLMLRDANPNLRLIISYADPAQGHHGGIYQAMNWFYMGSSNPQSSLRIAGKYMHKRGAASRWGTVSPGEIRKKEPGIQVEYGPKEWKHKYVYPLDKAMRRQIEPLAKPYPKRADVGEMESRPASSSQTLVQFQPSAPISTR